MRSSARARALDGLRGVSAQVVLVAHLFAGVFVLGAGAPSLVQTIDFWGWASRVAVIVFFCLSGYVIAGSIRGQCAGGRFRLGRFGLRRAARIMPPYLVAIAMSWTFFLLVRGQLTPGFGCAGTIDAGPVAIARAVAFLYRSNACDLITDMDGPLWTLRLEVIAYVISGLLAVAAVSRGRGMSWLAAVGAGLLFALISTKVGRFSALSWYAAGAAAAFGGPRRHAWFWPGAAGVLVLAGFPMTVSDRLLGGGGESVFAVLYQLAVAVCLANWINQLAHDGPGAGWLRRLEGMGAYSYTLYIIHRPIILLAQVMLPLRVPVVRAVAIFGIAQIAAFLLAKLVERPAWFHDQALALIAAAMGRRRLAASAVLDRPPDG